MKSNKYTPGKSVTATGTYAGVKWTWIVYLPKRYDASTAHPVIVHHPGWGLTAKEEEAGAGIKLYADEHGFISVTAQGRQRYAN